MNTAFILEAAEAINQAVINSEAEIESLDREIGDGDHFINMKRGCATIVTMRDELAELSTDAALNKIGMKLLSTIGGASGPLFASFFIAMGKTLKEQNDESISSMANAFDAGVQSIASRGKAGLGEKTMLDVLIPVANQFKNLAAKPGQEIAKNLQKIALDGVLATKDMIATKGRAAGLGERAIGHIDPGAKSCQVMVHTVCDLVLKKIKISGDCDEKIH
jgi:dihydroxyacetone kinase-like protein